MLSHLKVEIAEVIDSAGFGSRVFVVNAHTDGCVTIDLAAYFVSFEANDDYLLVAFGTGILRLDSRWSVLWENADFAIDCVEIRAIDGDRITGVGEWDPPGDWQPFTISLTTGRSMAS